MAKQSVQLKASQRSELGSRANRRLRATGAVPAVVYGHKQAVLPISLFKKEVFAHLEQGTHVFDLDYGDQIEKVLVKEVQYDHLGSDILHIDFARVSLDERVKVTVPLELRGTPAGEAEEGVLQQIVSELELECLVTDIPEFIRHNVAEMKLDDTLHIRDLKLPEGVVCLQEPDQLIAVVKIIEEEAEPAEAAAAEPEVIGKPAAEAAAAPAEGDTKKKA